jgi:hypothetical protein
MFFKRSLLAAALLLNAMAANARILSQFQVQHSRPGCAAPCALLVGNEWQIGLLPLCNTLQYPAYGSCSSSSTSTRISHSSSFALLRQGLML